MTQKGQQLAEKLYPSTGWHKDMYKICDLICRHATSYARIQESYCNGFDNPYLSVEQSNKIWERMEKQLEKREAQLERRLVELAGLLPLVNGQKIGVKFDGDPRGSTVKLVMPDGRYDGFGQDGIGVPGS